MSEVYATLRPSAMRRYFALIALAALGGVFLYLAITLPTTFLYRVVMIAIAAVCFVGLNAMYRSTAQTFTLSQDGLFYGDRVIATLDEVEKVEVGMFALKPTNGFAVLMKGKAKNTFQPGMYWRIGRRLGVGGVTEPGAAKFMADTLTAMVAEKNNT